MKATQILNRIRIVIASLLFIPSMLMSFFLLSRFIHTSIALTLILSILALVGFFLNKKLGEYTKRELNKLNDLLFQDIQFPDTILKIRDVGFELVFPLLLLAIGSDPIKDLIDLKPIIYKINYLFFDIALFTLFIAMVPMFVWMFYIGIKESIKKYW
ncbi:hypothetical protein [Paenibacillus amylolyticus]|uniref:PfkB domain-containing protein n=1 Tax=Paenibacillus amylolyticus TaxID=1451 RepID=A0A100VIB7_PAEAM|nr:hypothetical protein [Paenibacillus amylolyticus]GAS80368.1 PfkB domain-containing protein [Paenibacillus amylolyticus]